MNHSIYLNIEEIPFPNEVEFDAIDLFVKSIKLFGIKQDITMQAHIEKWFSDEIGRTLTEEARNILAIQDRQWKDERVIEDVEWLMEAS